ncbi:hypothetical protein B7486_05290 [cyanobacterium TDX16]|nr:hypothetical protein B7486_05290 [cyanobacterium TDX16]
MNAYRNILIGVGILLTQSIILHAVTINVPADAPTIQDAMDIAEHGDEIVLADGTYTGSDNEFIHFDGLAVTIRSASGDPSTCVIGTQDQNEVIFRFSNNETRLSRLENLTIHGRVENGRLSRSGDPTIVGCVFQGDYAEVYVNDESSPLISDCLFIDNQQGSPIWIEEGSSPLIVNCRILGNWGGNAGAANIHESSATFMNCEFINNRSDSFVGALWIRFGSTVDLINCAFVENQGGSSYGAIQLGQGNIGGNVLNVRNCVFWNNRRADGSISEETQIRVSTSDNLPSTVNIDHSTLSDWTGTYGGIGNNGTDPLFVDANGADDLFGTIDDDTRLMAGSPAIDSGNNNWLTCVGVDLDRDARYEDDPATTDTGMGAAPIIDRGPYEFGALGANTTDCNENLIDDACEFSEGTVLDCNSNGIPDECDIASGTDTDCNHNTIPDACELAAGTSFDCNTNGILDECDLAAGTSQDCNSNGVPDECDIASADSNDVNSNGIPDECEPDCNSNDVPDDWDLLTGASLDCNTNGTPDECDILPIAVQIPYETASFSYDWSDSDDDGESDEVNLPWTVNIQGLEFVAFIQSSNGFVELLRSGESAYDYEDYDVEGLINDGDPHHSYLMAAFDDLSSDEVGQFGYDIQADRVVFDWLTETYEDEEYGRPNNFQIVLYADGRVQWNFIFALYDDWDEDLFSGLYLGHDVMRLVEVARDSIPEQESWLIAGANGDCNTNGIPDECDIAAGTATDCNTNGIPDECDIAAGTATDCNTNGIPDECEPELSDCNNNGTPDVCEFVTDSDADGVADGCDACPGTFAGDTVDSLGCSTQDDDNDGVLNDFDHCRGTPPCAVASVDANGCPQDADADGLFDGCDNCPDADDLLDTDGDFVPDCLDPCPLDGDTDSDGVQDCQDNCPDDPLKLDAGACGCGVADADSDDDTIFDCIDVCPNNAKGLKVDEFGRPVDDRNGDCLVGAKEQGGPPTPGEFEGVPIVLPNAACAPMLAPGFLMIACWLGGLSVVRRRRGQ